MTGSSDANSSQLRYCGFVATRKPGSGEDEFFVHLDAIVLDVGAWLGTNVGTWFDAERHRQLDFGMVWGINVARLRVRPVLYAGMSSGIAKLHDNTEGIGQWSALMKLLDAVGREANCTIEIVNRDHLRPWFQSESSVQDFAATGSDISEAIVLIGDTHFGLRDFGVDDAVASDDDPICSPRDDIGNGLDNINLLIRLLSAFRSAGVSQIVQLGDFLELWETEYRIFARRWSVKWSEFNAKWRRPFIVASAHDHYIEYQREYLKLKTLETLDYERCLRTGPDAFEAESQIRAAWGGRLQALDDLISVRLRGNHDWQANGKHGEDGNRSVRLGYKQRVHIEHGHRFDYMNCYSTDWHQPPSWIAVGEHISDDLKEAEPAPRGKRATWAHAKDELHDPDNEHRWKASTAGKFVIPDTRSKMRDWIRSQVSQDVGALPRVPRVYVIGHTHEPRIERVPLGYVVGKLVCQPSEQESDWSTY